MEEISTNYLYKRSFKVIATKFDETELIKLLCDKDQLALSYLYDNYAANLNGIIFRIVNNKQVSEEILQEVFVKIWNNISKYDKSKGRLFTWMVSIARNLAIDSLRSGESKRQVKTNYGTLPADAHQRCEVRNFDFLMIDRHLRSLNAEHFKLIDLAYFYGMTQDEISKYTGMPLGTVKTKIRTAILKLRERLVA